MGLIIKVTRLMLLFRFSQTFLGFRFLFPLPKSILQAFYASKMWIDVLGFRRLLHDTQETSFYAGHTPPLQQNVTVRNTFSFPIVVYNVSVPRAIRSVLMVSQ